MVQNRDFRINSFTCDYEISNRKKSLSEEINKNHRLGIDVYSLVGRDDAYRKKLSDVYGRRCAYCGAILGPLPSRYFQVDHIICKKDVDSGVAPLGNKGNGLDNLAFSCGYCNSKKRDFSLCGEHFDLLSPDRGLGHAYLRDERYRIMPLDQYSSMEKVMAFYEKMRFDDDLRRVDYLLSSICDLYEHIERERIFGDRTTEICKALKAIAFDLLDSRASKW